MHVPMCTQWAEELVQVRILDLPKYESELDKLRRMSHGSAPNSVEASSVTPQSLQPKQLNQHRLQAELPCNCLDCIFGRVTATQESGRHELHHVAVAQETVAQPNKLTPLEKLRLSMGQCVTAK